MPKKEMIHVFNQYKSEFNNLDEIYIVKPYTTKFAQLLSYLSKEMSAIIKNNIVENFEGRVIKYIQHLISLRLKKELAKLSTYIYDISSGGTNIPWSTNLSDNNECKECADNISTTTICAMGSYDRVYESKV
ncbi:unnamed protein product [Cunninghamella blakesleeana]